MVIAIAEVVVVVVIVEEFKDDGNGDDDVRVVDNNNNNNLSNEYDNNITNCPAYIAVMNDNDKLKGICKKQK